MNNMKKILISIASFILLTSSNFNKYEDDWVKIYCEADLSKCEHNLIQLKKWLII